MSNSQGALENARQVLRRRWLVIVIAAISVPLAAYLYSSSQEKEYTATATLLFESSESGNIEASREAATNEALASLPAVAVMTAEALGEREATSEILDSVSASAANEMANLTKISATTPSPPRSAEIANAYSRAYIEFRREADQSQLKQAVALIEKRLEDLPPDELNGVQGESLRERLNQFEVERVSRTGRTELVQPAGIPTSPSSPRTQRNVLLGIVLGLMLGFGLAALLERLDRGVRTAEELEDLFELPTLARIPRSKAFANGTIEEMLGAPEAEAFWTLRNNLRYFKVDRDIRTLLIASAEPNDGKTTVARGLAGAMAAMGDDVVLVEADLRKEGAFRTDRAPRDGLSTVLTGAPLDSAIVHIPVKAASSAEQRTLPVLPSGPLPPNPAELLESERMRDLLAALEKRYELVLVDTPALGSISDVLTLIPLASEIVAVGGVGKTKRDEAVDFMKQLGLRGKRPLGLIATFTPFERSRYSYYRRSQPAFRG